MKSNQIGVLLLSSIVAAFIAGICWQKTILDELGNSLLAVQKQEKLAAQTADVPADVALASPATRGSEKPDLPRSAPSSPPRDVRAEMANDSRLQELQLAAHRSAVGARYSPLFLALGLNETQRGALQEAIALRDETWFDVNGIRDARQLGPDDPALLALKSAAGAKFKQAAEPIVGTAGYGELLQFEKTMPIRDFVNDLVGKSILSATPIDARTAAALVVSIDRETGGVYRLEQINDGALRVAEKNLSPEQQAIVKAMITENQGKRTLRAMAGKK